MASGHWSPFHLVLLALNFRGSRIALAEPFVSLPNNVTFRGSSSNKVEHFQNIRYGKDTSGSRRFTAPESFTYPPNTAVDAKAPGHACPQNRAPLWPFFDATPDLSEDCLNLRISRPAGIELTPESKVPVVIWITNGGVVKGSVNDSHIDPENLIKLSASDETPVIYVSFNYRHVIFGLGLLVYLS